MSTSGIAPGRSQVAVGPPLRSFRIDGWLVEPARNRLVRGDTVIHVRPQLIDVLSCLAARPGEVVAALRGVDVRLILPLATDSRVVDAASRTYHDALVRAGARIWLYGPPMLHAKTCVVDEDVAIVGTANLDNRSLRLNFEVTAVLYGPRPAAALAELFERDLAVARPKLEREADAPFLSRLAASAARLLAPQL